MASLKGKKFGIIAKVYLTIIFPITVGNIVIKYLIAISETVRAENITNPFNWFDRLLIGIFVIFVSCFIYMFKGTVEMV